MKTPHLLKLCKAGKSPEAKSLIETGVDINMRTPKGKTALMYACRSGCAELAEHLVRKGAELHCATLKGKTALHYAAAGGNTEIVELLIAEGCETEPRTLNGRTPLMQACRKGYATIVALLLRCGRHPCNGYPWYDSPAPRRSQRAVGCCGAVVASRSQYSCGRCRRVYSPAPCRGRGAAQRA